MNICKDSAGYVTDEHIKSKGFEVFKVIKGEEMGQMSWEMPQWEDDKLQIVGGYWHYRVILKETDEVLWEGWWNSNEEFDETMNNLRK